MSPEDFKAGRRALGLSVSELGRILDTVPRTIRKWEAGDEAATSRSVNPVAAQVMRWLLDGFRPPEWPAPRGATRPPDDEV